jgi:monothiol glutaredoxin
MKPAIREKIEDIIRENRIVLFIKGTVDFPQCGFSRVVITIFREIGMPYETVNIMANDALRQGMKEYSAYPAFPQVYIDGLFIGGCTEVRAMHLVKPSELVSLIERKPKERKMKIGSEETG